MKEYIFPTFLLTAVFRMKILTAANPATGMLTNYLNNDSYNLANSYVIGDRLTDVQLAKNLGCRAIWLSVDPELGGEEIADQKMELDKIIALETTDWKEIYAFLKLGKRNVTVERNTNETTIKVEVNVDGNGVSAISTGLGFFDHMLDQVARHGKIDLAITL